MYKEYAFGGYSKEEYLSLRKSNQSLLSELEKKVATIVEQESKSEPEESGDGNLWVVFKDDNYFQMICVEGMRECKSVESSNDLQDNLR